MPKKLSFWGFGRLEAKPDEIIAVAEHLRLLAREGKAKLEAGGLYPEQIDLDIRRTVDRLIGLVGPLRDEFR